MMHVNLCPILRHIHACCFGTVLFLWPFYSYGIREYGLANPRGPGRVPWSQVPQGNDSFTFGFLYDPIVHALDDQVEPLMDGVSFHQFLMTSVRGGGPGPGTGHRGFESALGCPGEFLLPCQLGGRRNNRLRRESCVFVCFCCFMRLLKIGGETKLNLVMVRGVIWCYYVLSQNNLLYGWDLVWFGGSNGLGVQVGERKSEKSLKSLYVQHRDPACILPPMAKMGFMSVKHGAISCVFTGADPLNSEGSSFAALGLMWL